MCIKKKHIFIYLNKVNYPPIPVFEFSNYQEDNDIFDIISATNNIRGHIEQKEEINKKISLCFPFPSLMTIPPYPVGEDARSSKTEERDPPLLSRHLLRRGRESDKRRDREKGKRRKNMQGDGQNSKVLFFVFTRALASPRSLSLSL